MNEFNTLKEKFDNFLSEIVRSEWDYPSPLRESMEYALFSGGKRYRPTLMLCAYRSFGGEINPTVLRFAVAIECLHTYSLVHDDLPCMDNDDMRRGVPTVHKKFNETTAVLAGDALLNYAYETIFSAIKASGYDKNFVRAGELFSKSTGASGMIKGQVLDLNFNGNIDELYRVYRHKTADLLSAAITIGAILAGASDEEVLSMSEFAYGFGYAFQIIDDILDGKNEDKCTILRFGDTAWAKQIATKFMTDGIKNLDKIHKDMGFFREFSAVALERIN